MSVMFACAPHLQEAINPLFRNLLRILPSTAQRHKVLCILLGWGGGVGALNSYAWDGPTAAMSEGAKESAFLVLMGPPRPQKGKRSLQALPLGGS